MTIIIYGVQQSLILIVTFAQIYSIKLKTNMKSISINDACIGCGLCAKVCPARVFKNTAPKKTPLITSPESCIGCGHCEAVCPSNAVNCAPFREVGHTCAITNSFTSQLASLRSVRNYKKDAIPTDDLNEIIQAGYSAPTAGNNMGVHISSYQGNDIEKLNTSTIQHLEKLTKMVSPLVLGTLKVFNAKKAKDMSEGVGKLKRVVASAKENEYHIFHKAPHAIIIHTAKSNRFGKDDADAALNYVRIAAHTMGYASCIIGFAMTVDKGLAKESNIPKDHKIHGILTLGKPTIKYSKGIVRNQK